jgi:hypothetical protein
MAFCCLFDKVISSFATEQSSAEGVLAAGMLVVDVLVLADDCTLYKCCIISLALETVADLLEKQNSSKLSTFFIAEEILAINTYLLPHLL